MSGRRLVVALLAMMLGAALINVLPGARLAAAQGDAGSSGSAMTLSGKGEFEKLEVTVSQTKSLINQVVTVTWQGGAPTKPQSGFGTDYLQIMQCWGDDPTGPDRTQCQFGTGGFAGTLSAGNWVRLRQLTYTFIDPNEKLTLGPPAAGNVQVPFWPVGREKPNGAEPVKESDFFSAQTSNEIPLARTLADGTGVEFFEVQTARQAPGLGCGSPLTNGGVITGQKCWLVVVPRDSTEVNGERRTNSSFLDSSPLSQSNWDDRIVFPLEFQPVGQVCPLGAAERRVVGHEPAVDAVSRWQPVLCAGGGAVYSYTQVSDDVARNLVLEGSSPGLAVMTNPIAPDQASRDRPLIYAPIALSGLAIAFNIEHQTNIRNSPAERLLDGQRFQSIKLTPRLVAKLLTQSYQRAVAGFGFGRVLPDYIKTNPIGLTLDPEFLEFNPEYKGFAAFYQPPDALVQLGNSDLTSLLWSWVTADPDARAFLAGTPDKYGMVVNPNNKDLILPTSVFPRNDQSCVDVNLAGGTAKSCTGDVRSYFNDMHDAGLSASRGDTGSRNPVSGSDGQPVPKKDDRLQQAQRALLAVVDTATAHRYQLVTATLKNAAGQFVAPTTGSLVAGAAAMKPSAVPGVLVADPGAPDPAAYPLTALSYAVASPSTLDAAAGKDYAAFVRYAAGPGQQPGAAPGQLPLGMVPLPDPLKAQAAAAAAAIEAQSGKNPSGTPTPPPTNAPVVPGALVGAATGGAAGTAGSSGAATSHGGSGTSPASPANAAPGLVTPPGGPATNAPGVIQQPVAGVLRRTPPLPAPAVGALLVTILICGALAATSSPVLHSPVIRGLGAAVLRRARKGVMPPER